MWNNRVLQMLKVWPQQYLRWRNLQLINSNLTNTHHVCGVSWLRGATTRLTPIAFSLLQPPNVKDYPQPH